MHELIIIGGGPAGAAAGVYAARKKIDFLQIVKEWGGQSIVSADIQNWIGTKSVSGIELAQMFEDHVKAQEGSEILDYDAVSEVQEKEDGDGFIVKTENGEEFETLFLLVCTGGHRRKLGVPGEKEFDGKGVAYCATCDAPLFDGKDVAVVGGGNAGLEAVVDLLPYAKNIYLLEYADSLKGDAVTQERIKKEDRVEIITMAETKEILGDNVVAGIKYVDRESGEEKELELGGVFVEIGMIPNADFVKDLVDVTDYGEIVVDHKTQQSSHKGIWAAGDVTDVLYKQNNISAGDAVKAILNIYDALNRRKAKESAD